MKFDLLAFGLVVLASTIGMVHGQHRNLGTVLEKDWSKRFSKFNMRRHLTTPTPSDLEMGLEHSRRLARNHRMLGLEDPEGVTFHRDLKVDNLDNYIKYFTTDGSKGGTKFSLPSEVKRFKLDEATDDLPFNDGPGKNPGCPKLTRDFWLGDGDAEVMFDIVACPVADVEAFLEDPFRCINGGQGSGTIVDFFSDIDSDAITFAMVETVIPLAVEAYYTASGLVWVDKMFESVCKIFAVLDNIIAAINFISGSVETVSEWVEDFEFPDYGDVFDSASGLAGDAAGGAADFIGGIFRGLEPDESFHSPCSEGHYEVCNTPPSQDEEFCKQCLITDGEECAGCRTCWKPLFRTIPDMRGLCLSTAGLRRFMSAPAQNQEAARMLNDAMMANYISDVAGNTAVVGALQTAVGTTGDGQQDLTQLVETLGKHLGTKIDNQCPVDNPGRRLNDSQNKKEQGDKDEIITNFLRSDKAKKAFKAAEDVGLSKDQAEAVFTEFMRQGSATKEEDNSDLNEKILPFFQENQEIVHAMDNLMDSASEENGDFVEKIAGRLLKQAIDPQTGKLNAKRVNSINRELNEIKKTKAFEKVLKQRQAAEEEQGPQNQRREFEDLEEALYDYDFGRCTGDPATANAGAGNAGTCTSTMGDFTCGCTCIRKEIKSYVKGFLEETMKKLLSGLLDGKRAYDNLEAIYQGPGGPFAGSVVLGPFKMLLGFIETMDPISNSRNSLQPVTRLIVKVFQIIVSLVLFGCSDILDPVNCKATLPSQQNKVLSITEDRNGDLYQCTGCNSEFEGEIVFYTGAHAIIDTFLDSAEDVILPLFNAPVAIIKIILAAVNWQYEHMENVCSWIDDYAELAKTEATFENTRWIMHEMACRPAQDGMKRGYGCDGIDNNCDDFVTVDECAEDVFPPEIDLSRVIENCSPNKIMFQTTEEAIACVEAYVEATDDCQEVSTTVSVESSAPVEAGSCGTQDTIKVVATTSRCSQSTEASFDAVWNDCNADNEPPVIDLSRVIFNCSPNKIMFQTSEEAIACIEAFVEATDNCQQVSTTVSVESSAPVGAGSCGTQDTIKVVATTNHCSQSTEATFDAVWDDCNADNEPPVIDLSRVIFNCSPNKIMFQTSEEAIACVEAFVEATDNCQEVSTMVSLESSAPVGAGSCGTQDTIKVVATTNHCSQSTEATFDAVWDDCNADQVAPEIDLSKAIENCSPNKFIFQSPEAAIACVKHFMKAEDDCQGISTMVDVTSESVGTGSCGSQSSIDVVATTTRGGSCTQSTQESFDAVWFSGITSSQCTFDKSLDEKPIIDITASIERCGGELFSTIAKAEECVLKNSNAVDAAGGCRPVTIRVESTNVGTCESTIQVIAEIEGCSDAGFMSTSDSITVYTDNTPPVVSCSFTADLSGKTSGNLENLGLNYSVTDECAYLYDMNVTVATYSNELEESDTMVKHYVKGDGKVGAYGVADACAVQPAQNEDCILDPDEQGRRFYKTVVTATDKAGLSSSTTCYIEVGDDWDNIAAPGTSDQNFLLAKSSYVQESPAILTVT